MKTDAQLFLQRMRNKIKIHMRSINFFLNRAICGIMWKKYCRATQATGNSITRAHEPWKLDNYIYRHTLRICNIYCVSI